MKIRDKSSGFTIVELMIATTVFSMVLLLCTYGLLEIGRAYYKGVTISRTHENARIIMDDVTEAIQFSHGQVVLDTLDDEDGSGYRAYCIGTKFYQFWIDVAQEENSGDNQVRSGTVGDCGNGPTPPGDYAGLLTNRARLAAFDITELDSENYLYGVTVRVVSGDDDSYDSDTGECNNEKSESQYCAITELNTVVKRRI